MFDIFAVLGKDIVYEVCCQMDTGDLYSACQTSWKMYDICNPILENRKPYWMKSNIRSLNQAPREEREEKGYYTGYSNSEDLDMFPTAVIVTCPRLLQFLKMDLVLPNGDKVPKYECVNRNIIADSFIGHFIELYLLIMKTKNNIKGYRTRIDDIKKYGNELYELLSDKWDNIKNENRELHVFLDITTMLEKSCYRDITLEDDVMSEEIKIARKDEEDIQILYHLNLPAKRVKTLQN